MLTRSDKELLYMQIYHYYKDLILGGKMKKGDKLPSIRKCASQLQVSRTTAEMAYMLLAADGYIISRPQSGYYVTGLWQEHGSRLKQGEPGDEETARKDHALVTKEGQAEEDNTAKRAVLDFSATSGGQESFNLDLWRRYIKSALRQGERLISYGDPQGEEDLRQVLSDYVTVNRNVVCSPRNLVIGAGFQSLLHILCPLVKDRRRIYFQDASFRQGQAVFEDYGFEVQDTTGEDGENGQAQDLVYVTPSHMNRWGDIMPMQERFALLENVSETGSLLIEDDYDSEFAYLERPAPALQGLDGGEHVIYLSTFSRMLLPSIRISFMILPDVLLESYEERKDLYNQTVSKADQIALCQYIRDGHLQYQIRKTRKNWKEKNSRFLELVREILRDEEQDGTLRISRSQTEMSVKIRFADGTIAKRLTEKMLQQGIRTGLLTSEGEKNDGIYLSCSSVPESSWEKALIILKQELQNLV